MARLLSAVEMRAIEAAAIGSGAVTGRALMERAGDGVVAALLAKWPEWRAPPAAVNAGAGARPPEPPKYLKRKETWCAVVLCGPGNNGGDGFVIARLLAALGWQVAVYLYGNAEKLTPDARANYLRWCEIGAVAELTAAFEARAVLPGADLVIDALFGTGLTRAIALPLQLLAGGSWRVVAVDIPSGLCSDAGRVIGDVVAPADLTVTFHRAKRGHHLADGPAVCGSVVVHDIGLPEADQADGLRTIDTVSPPLKSADAHKYHHGHAVVLTGGPGKGGAGRLAARAALRVGAGLVTIACPPKALAENAAQLNAIMLRPVMDAAAMATLLADQRFNAVCLGPGLGVGQATRAMVRAVLEESRGAARRVVIDADALTAFETDPHALYDALHPGCILTPHTGEFVRIFPEIAAEHAAPAVRGPAYSKVDATRAAAEIAGCTVLYKGADTVIADERGRIALHAAVYDRAAPWLATAGAGDVLSGLITGLLAQGSAPMAAAETAAWLHVEAARLFGPGLIAEDLPDTLPAVFRALEAG